MTLSAENRRLAIPKPAICLIQFKISGEPSKLLIGENRKKIYEPCSEKTGLGGFRPGPTKTGLYNHRRWLEA